MTIFHGLPFVLLIIMINTEFVQRQSSAEYNSLRDNIAQNVCENQIFCVPLSRVSVVTGPIYHEVFLKSTSQ